MYCIHGLIVPCNTTEASGGDSDLAVASGVPHKERRRAAPGLFNYIKVTAPSYHKNVTMADSLAKVLLALSQTSALQKENTVMGKERK